MCRLSRTPLKWWCTSQGRQIALGCVTACGLGAVATQWLPHTAMQDYLLPGLQLHRSGKPVPLSRELMEKYEQGLDILKVTERTKIFLKPFIVYGYDLYSTGSTKTKYGSNIGIPAHFEYNSPSDIDRNLLVKNKPIDWSSDAGTRLENTLVLTDNEKLFGICRELISVQLYKTHFFCLYPALTTIFIYGTSSTINMKFANYYRPRIVRVIIYSLIICFGVGLYFLMRDTTQFQYEKMVDEELCKLGGDFIESGISFYDKISKRNVAIQDLEGPESEMRFSKLGNENFLFRQQSTPVLTRKKYFESMLEKSEEL